MEAIFYDKGTFADKITSAKNYFDSKKKGKVGMMVFAGDGHLGHQHLYNMLKKECDYVLGFYFHDTRRFFNQLLDRFAGIQTIDHEFDENIEDAGLKWAKEAMDVVVDHIPDATIFLDEKGKSYQQCFAETPESWILGDVRAVDKALFRGFQLWHQYAMDYLDYDVYAFSQKEGLYKFLMEKWYIEIKKKEVVLIPAYREDGIALSTSFNYFVTDKTKEILKKILNGKPLLNDKNMVKQDVIDKLAPLEGNVVEFFKYSGPYLDYHKEEGDTYLFTKVWLKQSDAAPLRPRLVSYMDGIIL